MPPPKSAYSRLLDHFHTHPKGRLHEMLFWLSLGGAMSAFAIFGWLAGWISEPIAWLIGIVGVCLVGFGILPRHKKHYHGPAPIPKGKRGVIAQQVKASKSEKRKRPGTK